MSRWNPCKRVDCIKKLRALGFEGAYSGAKHQFMVFRNNLLTVPSNAGYSVPLNNTLIFDIYFQTTDFRLILEFL